MFFTVRFVPVRREGLFYWSEDAVDAKHVTNFKYLPKVIYDTVDFENFVNFALTEHLVNQVFQIESDASNIFTAFYFLRI